METSPENPEKPKAAEALIVGAGPAGLVAACELARHGLRPRIIDRLPEPVQTSRALAVFPRTLEVWAAMGVVVKAVAEGHRLEGISIHHEAGLLAHVGFQGLETPYPFVLSLPQSRTEAILTAHLASLGVGVERGTALERLEPVAEGVRATLRGRGGVEELEVPWLIGCDGAHSTVRGLLDIPFEGRRFGEEFILADVKVEGPYPDNEGHFFFSEEGLFAIFPLGGGRARLIASVPPGAEGDAPPDSDEFARLARLRGVRLVQIGEPEWLSRFHFAQRLAGRYSQGRVFLAGDAAHIHSPAGGQGMNTGIQDAFNLAWKLALVARGRARGDLLESYERERRPVAQRVLMLAGGLTRLATIRTALGRGVRNLLLPLASSLPSVEARIARRLAQLDVEYAESPIVAGHAPGPLQAGERAPDARVVKTVSQLPVSLMSLLRDPRHHLFIFHGLLSERPWAQISREITAHFADAVVTWEIGLGGGVPLWDERGEAHARYGAHDGALFLVRPDGYIGFHSDPWGGELLWDYLENTLGLTAMISMRRD